MTKSSELKITCESFSKLHQLQWRYVLSLNCCLVWLQIAVDYAECDIFFTDLKLDIANLTATSLTYSDWRQLQFLWFTVQSLKFGKFIVGWQTSKWNWDRKMIRSQQKQCVLRFWLCQWSCFVNMISAVESFRPKLSIIHKPSETMV